MRLGLSSAAAPEASFEELVTACQRRGLTVIELRAGDWHGIDVALEPGQAAAAVEYARAAGVEVCAYVADDGGSDLRLARVSSDLGVPLLVPGGTHALDRCVALASVGAHVAPMLSGDESDAELDRLEKSGLDVAWAAAAAVGELGPRAERLVSRFGARLRHVRLEGGGPESMAHEGRGIGDLLSRLALAGYTGTLALAPSAPRYRVLWQGWLGRRGGWGCGGSTTETPLARLETQSLDLELK